MGQKRIGPDCPYCSTRSLLCYGVLTQKDSKLRYFFCQNCGVRLTVRFRGNEMSWGGLVSPSIAGRRHCATKKFDADCLEKTEH